MLPTRNSPPTGARARRAGATTATIAAALALVATTLAIAAASFDHREPELVGLRGQAVDPLALRDAEVAVLVFVQSECPIANRYAPEIARMQRRFAPEGVRFWMVYPDPDDSAPKIREHLSDYEYGCAVVLDPTHELVDRVGATVTPEAAVFRGERLVYRGRITDRETDFGQGRVDATSHDLEAAIVAALHGDAPEVARTDAVGCYIRDLQ